MQSNGSAKQCLLQHRSPVDSLASPNCVLQPCFLKCCAQAAALPGLWWFASEVQPDP